MRFEPTRKKWDLVWKNSNIERPVHNTILNKILNQISPVSIGALEVGCGSGVDSAELASRGTTAIGMDYSLPALVKYAARDGSYNLPRVAGDTFFIPFASNQSNFYVLVHSVIGLLRS